jgi:hypothetical protein
MFESSPYSDDIDCTILDKIVTGSIVVSKYAITKRFRQNPKLCLSILMNQSLTMY